MYSPFNSISLKDSSQDATIQKTSIIPQVTVFEIERSDLETVDKVIFLRRLSSL